MKKILFATSEAVPFIKTGGLADVAGSLPKCFDKKYFDIRVNIISAVRNHMTVHHGILRNLLSFPKLCYRFFR